MAMMSRRQFNSTLAGAAILAPFMAGRRAAAGSAAAINKMIILMTISPVRGVWNLQDPTSFLFGPAMTAIKSKTILFDGIPMNDPSANHANPQSLTGNGFGVATNSFDVAIAKGLGGNYAIPNMVLGSGGSGGDLSIYWQDGKVVQPISDPKTAFTLAFGSSASTGSSGSGVDPAVLMRRRTAILDLLGGDIGALEGQSLTDPDQAKMELHRASAAQLRNRLSGGTSSSGGQCKPTLASYDAGNFAQRNALLMQVGTEALICGVTPVVGVMFGTNQGYTATSYDPAGPQFNGDTHGLFVHSYPNPSTAQYETFCAMQFANTVTSLAQAPSASGVGTMLDETIVLWARDMGDGQAHNSNKMPYVMAGGGGYFGYSAAGRVVDLSNAVNGRSHEGFLRTIAAAMGVSNLVGFGSKPSAGLITELR